MKRLAGLCLVLGAACQSARVGFYAQAPGATHPRGLVEIHGVDEQALERVQVSIAAEDQAQVPALLGSKRYENGRIVFEPRFPFDRGIEYRARLAPPHAGGGGREESWTFSFPKVERSRSTLVTHVYPSAEVLPCNLLKFYVHFSAPMRRGEAARRVRLLDDSGSELEEALLELESELWDPERRRLTLFFQPGRIKRGLVPHAQLGPVFEEGRSYTLEIDADWRDAQGTPLREGSSKTFRAGPPDRSSPDPARWQITPPQEPFTRNALHVRTDEALDHALLERVLSVRGPDGLPLAGITRVAEGETCWFFFPDVPWREGKHTLEIGTVLEDLAGNSVGRPFEEPPRPGDDPVPESVRVPFVVPRSLAEFEDPWGSLFGHSVAALGDLDGDGTDDFAVGAPVAWTHDIRPGSVLVLSGASFDVMYRLDGSSCGDGYGTALLAIGDRDGDGAQDFVVGHLEGEQVHVVSGRSGRALQTISGARCLGPIGDLDGDGALDLVVSGCGQDSRDIWTRVISSQNGSVLWEHEQDLAAHVLLASDVDGDGFRELVFSPSRPSNTLAVVSGKDGSTRELELPWTNRPHAPSRMPIPSACADLDGDGRDEIVANASDVKAARGRLFVLDERFGLRTLELGPVERVKHDLVDLLNYRLVSPGDLDGDGSDDLLVGIAHMWDTRVSLISGRTGARLWKSRQFTGQNLQTYATLSDRTGDGVPEILVGSVLHNTGFSLLYGTIRDPWAGFVSILSGSDGKTLHKIEERAYPELGPARYLEQIEFEAVR